MFIGISSVLACWLQAPAARSRESLVDNLFGTCI